MTASELAAVAGAIVAPGKGILAADESTGTIARRFDSINVQSTEASRRAYRELLLSTAGAATHIGGVILYDETLRQSSADGTPFPKLLADQGIAPGIKVDTGAKDLAGAEGEKVTEGLDGLGERLAEYAGLGAEFTKWRAVITIGHAIPSRYCLEANAHALARFAALSQAAGLVPIVEPEVLLDGSHTIERCQRVTEATAHLNAMNGLGSQPGEISFSFGRALQQSALAAWGGEVANVAAAQAAYLHRARMNGLARAGDYEPELEQAT